MEVFMDKGMKVIVALLIFSIVFNFFIYTRFQETESEVKNLSNNMSASYENLNNSISKIDRHVSNRLDEFVNDNSWVISEEFIIDYEKTTNQEVHLDIQWSFNEIEESAKVYLVYSDESGKYVKEEAIKQDNGMYKSSLILFPDKIYKYKIMSEGSVIKAIEEKEIPEDYYKPGRIEISDMSYEESNGNLQSFAIDVTQRGNLISGFYKPEKLQLIINYRNNKMEISEFQFKSESLFTNIWSAKIDSFKDKTESIVLEIKYENGYIDSNEVWPKDKFSEKLKYN
jgi:preprotein translocase subunit YajC